LSLPSGDATRGLEGGMSVARMLDALFINA
jgi:hypothetical protein